MTEHRQFTKKFKNEAVRPMATGGRTQRKSAEDFGVGLLALVRWFRRTSPRLV